MRGQGSAQTEGWRVLAAKAEVGGWWRVLWALLGEVVEKFG